MAKPPIQLDPTRNPWDRQPKESPAQHARFATYRDLGRLRSLQAAHQKLTEAGVKLTYGSLRQVSYEFQWTRRAEAWDLSYDQKDHERLIEQRREMITRHQAVAKALLAAGIRALQLVKPEDMTPRDIAQFLKLGTDIERIAIGEPQRIVAVTGPSGGPIQTEDVTTLSAEERRARLADVMAELARRAGVDEVDEDE